MINIRIEDQSQKDLDIASEFPVKEKLQVILRFDLGWKWTLFHTWHITDQQELVWLILENLTEAKKNQLTVLSKHV